MSKQIFLIIAISLGLSTRIYSQYFPIDTAKLNKAYRELEKNPGSVELSKDFFSAFPSTWMEFIMTYQFMRGKNYDLTMYSLCDKHIEVLLKICPAIPDSVYCDKLISLSIGGRWDADAPSALKTVLHKAMLMKTQSMFDRLSKQTRGFQLRFWQFYWSSLLANRSYDAECEQLKKIMGNKKPDEVKTMVIALGYAWQEMIYPVENFPHKWGY